jgi:large subunit ribosomal protein L29
MRAEEIREMTLDDIAVRIRELEEERFRLRFRSATEPLEDPLRLRVIRRDVARLKTVLRERQTEEKTAAAKPTKTGRSAKRAGAAR